MTLIHSQKTLGALLEFCFYIFVNISVFGLLLLLLFVCLFVNANTCTLVRSPGQATTARQKWTRCTTERQGNQCIHQAIHIRAESSKVGKGWAEM